MSRVDPMPNKCKVLLMSMCKRFRWTVGVLRVDTDLDGPGIQLWMGLGFIASGEAQEQT